MAWRITFRTFNGLRPGEPDYMDVVLIRDRERQLGMAYGKARSQENENNWGKLIQLAIKWAMEKDYGESPCV